MTQMSKSKVSSFYSVVYTLLIIKFSIKQILSFVIADQNFLILRFVDTMLSLPQTLFVTI